MTLVQIDKSNGSTISIVNHVLHTSKIFGTYNIYPQHLVKYFLIMSYWFVFFFLVASISSWEWEHSAVNMMGKFKRHFGFPRLQDKKLEIQKIISFFNLFFVHTPFRIHKIVDSATQCCNGDTHLVWTSSFHGGGPKKDRWSRQKDAGCWLVSVQTDHIYDEAYYRYICTYDEGILLLDSTYISTIYIPT